MRRHLACWTDSRLVASETYWLVISARYFYIGPCRSLIPILAPASNGATIAVGSVPVGKVVNVTLAPQAAGPLSD